MSGGVNSPGYILIEMIHHVAITIAFVYINSGVRVTDKHK